MLNFNGLPLVCQMAAVHRREVVRREIRAMTASELLERGGTHTCHSNIYSLSQSLILECHLRVLCSIL